MFIIQFFGDRLKENDINSDKCITFLCGCLMAGCVTKVLSVASGVGSPASIGCTCMAGGCRCKWPAGWIGTATIFCRGTPQGRYQDPGWCCIASVWSISLRIHFTFRRAVPCHCRGSWRGGRGGLYTPLSNDGNIET